MKPNFDKEEYKYLKQCAEDDGVFVYTRKPNGTSIEGVSVAFKPMHYGAEARMIAVAVSYCAPEDEFRKKTGKYNALSKLYSGEYVQLPMATFLASEGADVVGEYLLDTFSNI